MNQQFFIGKIFKIDDTLTAEISIFNNTQPFKNCKFFGIHSSEIKVGDEVLILMLSQELFLYTPLRVNSFLGLEKGNSAIDLSINNEITIKANKVIIKSDDVKIGSSNANLTPLTTADISKILVSTDPLTGQGSCTTLSGIPSAQKIKIE